MTQIPVSIVRAPSYEPEAVRAALARLLAPLGGMAAFVSRGDRVLVKPNFLLPRSIESGVTTHPEVIQAVAEAVLEAGAKEVLVGDSPGFGSALSAMRKIRVLDSLRAVGAVPIDFDQPVVVENKERLLFRRFEVERRSVECDKVVSLCKVKTHMQMFMTLAVKNTFGCVVGTRKASWHMEAGRDEELFASMLLDLHRFVKPALNIADGILVMEGNGPSNGKMKHVGLLFASADGVALDAAVCDVLRLPLDHLPTHQAAVKAGMPGADLSRHVFVAEPPDAVRIEGIRHPRRMGPGDFYVPGPLKGFARWLLEARPTIRGKQCGGCAICQSHCPASAVAVIEKRNGKKRAVIDYDKCIHCYCCQELCPEGAVSARRGIMRVLMK